MVCSSCWVACPFNTYWYKQLGIQHCKLTRINNILDNLELHLRTFPDKDPSYIKNKIKSSVKKRIRRKEFIISKINHIIDDIQCPQCNSCPY
jgi:ferredoxin